jgi:hypothetical protein
MRTFAEYLIEASLHKVDALLRMHPGQGMQPGYVHVNTLLGPRANDQVCKRALALLDDVKAKRITPTTLTHVPVQTLIPTQYALYAADVKDIIQKRAIHTPIDTMKYQGRTFILNGHHRAAAASALLAPSILARVYEV